MQLTYLSKKSSCTKLESLSKKNSDLKEKFGKGVIKFENI